MMYKYKVTIESETAYDPDELAYGIFELLGTDSSVSCEEVTDESDDN